MRIPHTVDPCVMKPRFEIAKCQLCRGTILLLLSEIVIGTSSLSFYLGNAREMEVKRTFWHFTAENTHVTTLKNIALWLLV